MMIVAVIGITVIAIIVVTTAAIVRDRRRGRHDWTSHFVYSSQTGS